MYRISAYDRDGRQVAVVEAGNGEVTIGREADRRLVLPSPSVSRRHARIVLDGPQPFIADEGSANGVLVNGVRIGGPTALVPGVRIDVAEFWLDFAMAGPPQQQYQPPPPQQPQYQPPPPQPQPVAAPSLRLRAQGGPFAGRAFEIPQGRVSIGRAIDNDLVFDDPSLSRKHSVVHTVGPDRIELQDLGSSNGTWVNGRKIESGVATIGDAVRFGDLMFALEGDAQVAPRGGQPDYGQQAAYGGGGGAPRRSNTLLYAGIGVVVLAAAVGVTVFALRGSKGGGGTGGGGGGGGGETGNIAEQVEQHLKAGKDKLADKQFDAAVAEFDRTLELDPTNGEARKLKLQAAAEPANAKIERNITAKLAFTSRTDFENVVKLLGQMPGDSVFHDPTAQKVATRLVTFGDTQCKAKKFVDCAWAICKAIEVVPSAARAGVVTSAAEAAMHDAEKKAAKEKGFSPCKKK